MTAAAVVAAVVCMARRETTVAREIVLNFRSRSPWWYLATRDSTSQNIRWVRPHMRAENGSALRGLVLHHAITLKKTLPTVPYGGEVGASPGLTKVQLKV